MCGVSNASDPPYRPRDGRETVLGGSSDHLPPTHTCADAGDLRARIHTHTVEATHGQHEPRSDRNVTMTAAFDANTQALLARVTNTLDHVADRADDGDGVGGVGERGVEAAAFLSVCGVARSENAAAHAGAERV